jgi:hypothetical protein
MNRLWEVAFALFVLGSLAFGAPPAGQGKEAASAAQKPKVMREFRGVRLGLKPDEVHAAIGKPESTAENREEYRIGDEDQLAVHYENGVVKAIQIFFASLKNVPPWAEVVGDIEITQNDNGSKHARRVLSAENFWVSMWQNKSGTMTTIIISR